MVCAGQVRGQDKRSGSIAPGENTRTYTSSPNNVAAQDKRYNGWGSGHPGVCCFVFADGSTRAISETINRTVLTAITTRAGAETTDNPD